jgi:UDP-2,4-diacetamido-2,4,6-trideoxy-beta-L-altropyranose hydrolase
VVTHSLSAAARVDADAEIGLGHLKRCVTLLKRLKADGYAIRLVVRRRFPAEVAALTAALPCIALEDATGRSPESDAADADATLSAIGPAPRSWVILDHYGLGEPWERRVKHAGHRLLVFDDYRHRPHCADILVSDGTAPFDPGLLGSCDRPRVLTGHAYALIEEEFRPAPPRVIGRAKSLLITYGGSDPTGETAKALDAVRRARSRHGSLAPIGHVDVVIGPLNPAGTALALLAQQIGAQVHLAPLSLAPLMREADLVLTAGGHTVIEALALRKPCLVTVVADNQRAMVAELETAGVITVMGDQATVSADALADGLDRALAGYTILARRASESTFDHHGAARISRAMQDSST